MLGKKKFLCTTYLFIALVLLTCLALTSWWAGICRDALPDNPWTAFFYYVMLAWPSAWITGGYCYRFCKWNAVRYHAEYTTDVNNFLRWAAPGIIAHTNRYTEFKELQGLLEQTTNKFK